MKLATFTDEKGTRIGVVTGTCLMDLSEVAPELPTEMRAFLEAGPDALATARRAAQDQAASIAIDSVRLEAPVMKPRKFFAIAQNYRLLAPFGSITQEDFETIRQKQNTTKKEGRQAWYNKQVTCINGPFDPVTMPRDVNEVYFEAELAMVIGRECRDVSEADAPDYIAGYMVCNDVTEGAWCRLAPTLTMGKSFDTFGPTGPWITTPDEIADPHALEIVGTVNGERQQVGNTKNMIFNCYELLAFASRRCTLEPGDIVTTGMPYGPLNALAPGDVIRCGIEGLGYIENRMAG